VSLINVNVSQATADGEESYGGCIYISDEAQLNVTGGNFRYSKATLGGGWAYIGGSARVRVVNASVSYCGTDSGDGGAVFTPLGHAGVRLNIAGCTFMNNTALQGSGGVLYFPSLTPGDVAFSSSTFLRNRAKYGGVVYSATTASNPTFAAGNVFTENTANLGDIQTSVPSSITGPSLFKVQAGSKLSETNLTYYLLDVYGQYLNAPFFFYLQFRGNSTPIAGSTLPNANLNDQVNMRLAGQVCTLLLTN
jgi:hypothetical protein